MKTPAKILGAVIAVAGLAALCGPANALTVYTVGMSNGTTPGGDPGQASGQTLVDDFGGSKPEGNETDAGGGTFLYSGTSNIAADPYGDNSQYEALQPGQTATFTFAKGTESISAYLGSIDTYNYIDVLGLNGKVDYQITGTDLLLNNYGNQTAAITNRRVFISNLPSDFSGLLFGTTGIAFEYDDIYAGASADPTPPGGPILNGAVPEPASWAMMLLGFGAIGGTMRKVRRQSARASAAA
jgi:hypothetical protein